MLTVDYNKYYGYITFDYVDGVSTLVNIYESNALLAMIYEQDDKKHLYSFFADDAHAKNCLGLTGQDNIFGKDTKVYMVISKEYKHYKKIVQWFLQAFNDITIRTTI